MDFKKRLLRKPVQTILWQIILIAMALLIGAGSLLFYSCQQLPHVLDEYHTSIAAQLQHLEALDNYSTVMHPISLYPEDIKTLTNMDTVEAVDLRTLTGAYIPELSARIGLRTWSDMYLRDVDDLSSWFANDSYDRVILSGTVEQAWITPFHSVAQYDLSAVGGPEHAELRTCYALMNIEEIISAHEDYIFFPDEHFEEYTGKIIVHIPVCCEEGAENFFEVGQTYVVQGDYDPSVYKIESAPSDIPFTPHLTVTPTSQFCTLSNCLAEGNQLVFYPESESETTVLPSEGTSSDKELCCLTGMGSKRLVIAEKAETSVAELISQEPWADIIEESSMTLHSFPVIGTEHLESMYVFVKNEASIVDGRTFTQEDYDAGNKVCIISESVANAAGVKVGDSITFNQFIVPKNAKEGNPHLEPNSSTGTLNNPDIGFPAMPHGLATENESFTVAGIYRLENEWQNSSFSITPNTVFIPQKAQLEGGFGGPSYEYEDMITTYQCGQDEDDVKIVTEPRTVTFENGVIGVYMSVILKNGQMDAFLEEIQDTPLAERKFLTFDQGYDAAQESIQAVIASAKKLFLITVAGWCLLLVLYVLLYQARERRNLGIMRSLGAKPGQAQRYLILSGLIPGVVGIIIGTMLSGVVTKLVQNQLIALTLTQIQSSTHSGGMALDSSQLAAMLSQSETPFALLLILAVLQIAVVALILWLHGALLARKNVRKLLGV